VARIIAAFFLAPGLFGASDVIPDGLIAEEIQASSRMNALNVAVSSTSSIGSTPVQEHKREAVPAHRDTLHAIKMKVWKRVKVSVSFGLSNT